MRRRSRVFSFLVRFLLLLILWWSLAEGDLYGWPLALLFVAAGTAVSMVLLPPPPWRPRPLALARFVLFFLEEMLLGGIDVARRALDPRMRISPEHLRFPLRLEKRAERLLFAWATSLLPGTVFLELGEREAEIHLLDVRMSTVPTLEELERRISRLFTDE